ncbi:hypothetical protein EVAR_94631_1 [Eumeta japonica]|uniref:Uncharacterized protein n=1 Tax=Eumeta variegata TaxID=151549 RepID=A0A4C1UTJ7_EUMVA|nr:hypothetical protein EVAR_94631_1 [Eumeta japonica]
MCLEKVKSMVVPLSVVDLLTSDAQSRSYISFMNLRNLSSVFTFVLKSPQRRIGTSGSTCHLYNAVAALHHSWTSATSGLRGLFLITCRQNFFDCEDPSGAMPSAVADVADA